MNFNLQVSKWTTHGDSWEVVMSSRLWLAPGETLTSHLRALRQQGMRLPNGFSWQLNRFRGGRQVASYGFLVDAAKQPFFWPPANNLPKVATTLLDRAMGDFQRGRYFLDVWTPEDKFALYFKRSGGGLDGLQFIPGDDSGQARWFELSLLPNASKVLNHPVLRRYFAHITQFSYCLTESDEGWKVYAAPDQKV